MENEQLFCRVEVARHSEFHFGAGLSKKDGFSLKKHSDTAQVRLFAVGMCQNHVNSDDCCGTPFSVQKLHSSAIALLQIFKLFFAGSQVAGSQVATIL